MPGIACYTGTIPTPHKEMSLSVDPFAPHDPPARSQAEAYAVELVQWKRQGVAASDVPLGTVGLIGAGMMGTAIAAACVQHQVPVVLTDTLASARASALERIGAELAAAGCAIKATSLSELVRVSDDLAEVARCDLVLESVPEKAALKQEIYRALQPHLRPESILASNTSTIPIGQLAAEIASPERFCGIHFFHPVRQRPLVEVIRGPQSSAAAIDRAVALANRLDRIPVVVQDGPGFLVNRLLIPYFNEALELLSEGVPSDRIEAAAERFGMAKGPLRLMDEIGLDTTLLSGQVLWRAFSERIVASPLLVGMVKYGLLGQKAGAGFFQYPEVPATTAPRRTFAAVLAMWQRPPQPIGEELLLARLFLPMVLEATRILDDGTVTDPREIDLAVRLGLGFPAARGGLLYWADSMGAGRIVELLAPLASLGPRTAPTERLLRMARSGERFLGEMSS